jgi:hypothetical protein
MHAERRNMSVILKKDGRGLVHLLNKILSEPIKRTVSQIDADQFNTFIKKSNQTSLRLRTVKNKFVFLSEVTIFCRKVPLMSINMLLNSLPKLKDMLN